MQEHNIHRKCTIDAALVVASDIHLQSMEDLRARLLMDALSRLSQSVECLVLNGDIFDFCFGPSRYFRRKFAPLMEALEGVAAQGVRVVFVEGNHEFHLRAFGFRRVELVVDGFCAVQLRDGTRIKIGHGDLLLGDPLYAAFRAVLKSSVLRYGAAVVPGPWLDAYALRHARYSRSRDPYRTLDHGRVLAAAEAWLTEGIQDPPFQHGIIGHYHTAYHELRRTGSGSIVSVESWDRPNLLVFRQGAFERVYLEEPGRPLTYQPAKALF